VRLSIAIPEAQLLEAPAVLQLIRQAQASDMEADDQGPAYVAYFEDLLQSVTIVAQLIEESRDPHRIRITVDERPVLDPVTFYQTLGCYRESLGAPDRAAHCLQRSAKGDADGRCPDRSCGFPCPFICSQCVGVPCHQDAPPPTPARLLELARQADVDWCPNLRMTKAEA
jgi:hypothetical protein